jgi:hypothetical protein
LHETLFSEFSLYQTSHAISTTKFLDDMNAWYNFVDISCAICTFYYIEHFFTC